MKIAVLSDTHMSFPDEVLIREFENRLTFVDVVLHLGDYTSEDVYMYLNSHPRFYGVAGNMDAGYWTIDVASTLEVTVGNIKIGLLHGYDLDFSYVERDITSRFSKDVKLFCFGHTHIRFFKEIEGRYILNPGSFTYPKGHKRGYAIIELNSDNINVNWIDL